MRDAIEVRELSRSTPLRSSEVRDSRARGSKEGLHSVSNRRLGRKARSEGLRIRRSRTNPVGAADKGRTKTRDEAGDGTD